MVHCCARNRQMQPAHHLFILELWARLQNSVPWGFRPEAPIFCWLSVGGCCPSWKLPTNSGHVAASQQAPHFFKASRRLSLQEPLQRRSQIMWCIQGRHHPTRQKWTLSRKLLITSWTYSGLLWRWFLACEFYLIRDQKILNCAVSLHCVFHLQLLKMIDLQTPTLYLWSDQGRIKVNYTKLRKNTIPETLSFLLAHCPVVTCTNIS